MTDHSKYQQRATKDDIIDLTSDSNDDVIVSNGNMRSVDIHFNNNPFADDDDDEFDDGVSMMHQLGSVTCTVREKKSNEFFGVPWISLSSNASYLLVANCCCRSYPTGTINTVV